VSVWVIPSKVPPEKRLKNEDSRLLAEKSKVRELWLKKLIVGWSRT
jgi:hypothetical protein